MDITAVRQALAANLSTLLGTQVSPKLLPNPTPPAAHIFPSDTEFDKAFGRGQDFQVLTIQVLAGLWSDEVAQDLLDSYLSGSGPKSVKAAAESDKKLGGACHDLRVTNATGYRRLQQEGQPEVLVCDWRVEIHGPGT